MLFNSYAFLLFLPAVFFVYWSASRSLRLQNLVLLTASYVFYGLWDVRFLVLIAGMTIVGFLAGRMTARKGAGSTYSRVACIAAAVVCIGTLCAFKYYDFFVTAVSETVVLLGLGRPSFPLLHLILPVGISFYTFQVMSYVIDVHQGRISPTADLLSFATFVSFFPQLVAGPIERAGDLLPQIERPRRFDQTAAVDGMRLMLWGLVKKVVVADSCASAVNLIYGSDESSGFDLWCGTVLFAFQIYGDFSGYSDMAVGMARLFGIKLTTNFRLPYFSRTLPEFWRRWHVSLTRWFRDYVYIPLGGSRRGLARMLFNTFVVFLISGLWHGADWTFLCWGLYLALCFVPYILLGYKGASSEVVTLRDLPYILFTFLLVVIGWVFFRSESMTQVVSVLTRMFTDFRFTVPPGGRGLIALPLGMMFVEWRTRRLPHPLAFDTTSLFARRRALRWSVYFALTLLTLYYSGGSETFIYFQF